MIKCEANDRGKEMQLPWIKQIHDGNIIYLFTPFGIETPKSKRVMCP
jgi:hypothetical protein